MTLNYCLIWQYHKKTTHSQNKKSSYLALAGNQFALGGQTRGENQGGWATWPSLSEKPPTTKSGHKDPVRCTFYGLLCASYSPCTHVHLRLLWTRESWTGPVQFVYSSVWLVKSFSIMMSALGFPWIPTKARSKDYSDSNRLIKKHLASIFATIKFSWRISVHINQNQFYYLHRLYMTRGCWETSWKASDPGRPGCSTLWCSTWQLTTV